MRVLTAVFVGLVILPGLVLAWLGFQYAGSLEAEARATIERELNEEMARQKTLAREAAGQIAAMVRSEFARKSKSWARDLPFRERGERWIERFELNTSLGDIRTRVEAVDAAGRPIGERELSELPEWPMFAAVRERALLSHWSTDRGDARELLLDAEGSFVSPRLREQLRGLAHAMQEGEREQESGELVYDHPLPHGGRLLFHTKWAGRPERSRGHRAIEIERRLVKLRSPSPPSDDFGVRTETFGPFPAIPFGIRVAVRHPAATDLESASNQRRYGTIGAILALLALMISGLWLARRALSRERAARQLRDAFIANVSHELRTPLTSVRLYAEMLEEDLPAEKRREYGRVVDAEGARLAALVDDMLDFTALERGVRELEIEPTDVTRAAEGCCAAWRPSAERDGFELAFDGSEWIALADATALGRILNNLLQNACKHGRPARDGGVPRIRVVVDGSVSVCDNGPGVQEQDRESMFERFRRGSDAGNRAGAGIGLALARELAEAMGGSLVHSDDGDWTRFTLHLRSET